MPVTGRLDYHWHDTPNIHLCTIRDFVEIVDELGAHIEREVAFDRAGAPIRFSAPWWVWNLSANRLCFCWSVATNDADACDGLSRVRRLSRVNGSR